MAGNSSVLTLRGSRNCAVASAHRQIRGSTEDSLAGLSNGPPERCCRVGCTLAEVEAMCLGSRDAGLKEDVVGAVFLRPRLDGRHEAGPDTLGAPFGVHSKILDRGSTTEAHGNDVEVDAGNADQLVLLRAGCEQCDVFVCEDLRGAFDGAVAVPARWTTAGR